MSIQQITNYFRLHNVKQFQESVSEVANSVYYVFAGKSTPYSAGDATIPAIINSDKETFYDPYENMVFGKRVTPSSVVVAAPRYDWTANTKYIAYRGDIDLSDKQYYACVNTGATYAVFKCLDNFGNSASTIQPDPTQTSPNDEYYSTADGYVWKYMYDVDATIFNTYATPLYLPIIANNAVVANAVPGALEVFSVTYRGSNYNTFLSNSFISTDLRVGGSTTTYNIANNAINATNFYQGSFLYLTSGPGAGEGKKIVDYQVTGSAKTVTLESAFTTSPTTATNYEITPSVLIYGDGNGAVARAIVNTSASNSIIRIEVLSRGNNYSWAEAEVVGNTGGVSNTATIVPILGPKGGHGSNPEHELGGTALCISISFANTETGTIPVVNDYRQIGLIKDPLFSNVVISTLNLSGSFAVGETVTQANTGATGLVAAWDGVSSLQLTSVNGIILTGNTTVNFLTGGTTNATASVSTYQNNGAAKNFNTFDQRHRYTFNPISGVFIQDEQIFQTDIQLANAFFHSNTASTLALTNQRGNLNTGNTIIGQQSSASANLLFYIPPDLIVGSGEVMFIENQFPISRSNSQTETVKLILQF